MNNLTPTTILFLSASPRGRFYLRLDEERREIEEGLIERSRHRDQFHLVKKDAVRPRDIQQAMLDNNPQIVHFSGHGEGEEGLLFEDETGQPAFVDGEALAELFKLFSDKLQCVVLNACYSETQADVISQHIPYVICMSQGISDRAAIEFAVGFYVALGAGRDIEFAFKVGCNAIRMVGIAEHLVPILKQKPGLVSSNFGSQSIHQKPKAIPLTSLHKRYVREDVSQFSRQPQPVSSPSANLSSDDQHSKASTLWFLLIISSLPQACIGFSLTAGSAPVLLWAAALALTGSLAWRVTRAEIRIIAVVIAVATAVLLAWEGGGVSAAVVVVTTGGLIAIVRRKSYSCTVFVTVVLGIVWLLYWVMVRTEKLQWLPPLTISVAANSLLFGAFAWIGTWIVAGALFLSRNELLKSFTQFQTSLMLAGVSWLGLGLGWVGYWLFQQISRG